MDMGSMTTMPSRAMSSWMTMASSMAAASASPSSSMSMGGMDMGMGGEHACKISMLWNWNTLDACFLASSWHITSTGMFAGSCIGVIALVMLLEFIRRVQREYDRLLRTNNSQSRIRQYSESQHLSIPHENGGKTGIHATTRNGSGSGSSSSPPPSQPTSQPRITATANALHALSDSRGGRVGQWQRILQQAIRSFIYTCQFCVAYIVMLLAMYYNGFIIISILIGAFLGHFVWSWDMMRKEGAREEDGRLVPCCA